MGSTLIDLTGKTFGKLKVLERAEDYVDKHGNREVRWLCQCNCDNQTKIIVRGRDLRNGRKTSCGCDTINRSITHGCHNSPLYNTYRNMIKRCYDKTTKYYNRYGGRGIYICDEWLQPITGIQTFIDWAYKNGYVENSDLSIDRINNDGPYTPWNCRWATKIQQGNNKSNNIFLTYNGETHTISEWGRIVGINDSTIRARLVNGMTAEEALTSPLDYGNASFFTNSNGETHTIKEWSEITGITVSALKDRLLKHKWDIDRALNTPMKDFKHILQYNCDGYTYKTWDHIMGFSEGTTYNVVKRKNKDPEYVFSNQSNNEQINAIYFIDDQNNPYTQDEWNK